MGEPKRIALLEPDDRGKGKNGGGLTKTQELAIIELLLKSKKLSTKDFGLLHELKAEIESSAENEAFDEFFVPLFQEAPRLVHEGLEHYIKARNKKLAVRK